MIRGAVAIFKRDFKKFLSNPFVVIMTLMMPIMYPVSYTHLTLPTNREV